MRKNLYSCTILDEESEFTFTFPQKSTENIFKMASLSVKRSICRHLTERNSIEQNFKLTDQIYLKFYRIRWPYFRVRWPYKICCWIWKFSTAHKNWSLNVKIFRWIWKCFVAGKYFPLHMKIIFIEYENVFVEYENVFVEYCYIWATICVGPAVFILYLYSLFVYIPKITRNN